MLSSGERQWWRRRRGPQGVLTWCVARAGMFDNTVSPVAVITSTLNSACGAGSTKASTGKHQGHVLHVYGARMSHGLKALAQRWLGESRTRH